MKTHLTAGQKLYGFTVIYAKKMPELEASGLFLRHQATGCEVFHLLDSDQENLFAFIFRTPVNNNNGVAHILEHSVLAGSQKYPLKDPFQAMFSGSVHTFLNAMTYPDKTVYPAASVIEKDYFNLMSVYGDAVFFPLLRRETFLQEGWRIEGEPQNFSGIVFNEMRGAYASFDSLVNEWSYRPLFPDSPYFFDTGGEPTAIVDLSYEDFRAFHRQNYHPANCRIFLHGNIDTEKQLRFLEDNFLNAFNSGRPSPELPLLSPWPKPKYFYFKGPAEESGEQNKKPTITINWRLSESRDQTELLLMEVIANILIGHPGAPLYKAIVDCNLGDVPYPASGLDSSLREMVFTIGVCQIEAADANQFVDLVERVLNELRHKGVDPVVLAGSLHQVEFKRREIKGGYNPYGLKLMERALQGWLHGQAPENTLLFNQAFAEVKNILCGPKAAGQAIGKRLLDNQCRSVVIVSPDQDYLAEQKRLLTEKLKKRRKKDTGKPDEQAAFDAYQKKTDSAVDLEKIPSLILSDLPTEISHIDTRIEKIGDQDLYLHPMFTNGIAYVDLIFDLEGLSPDDTLWLPHFTTVLCHAGLPDTSYDKVATRLQRLTGGLKTSLESAPFYGQPDTEKSRLLIRIKFLEENSSEALELCGRLLGEGQTGDPDRNRELLTEQFNGFKSFLLRMGSSLALDRAASGIRPAKDRQEAWHGASQLLFLEQLCRQEAAAYSQRVFDLHRQVIDQKRLSFNITADSTFMPTLKNQVARLASSLSRAKTANQRPAPKKSTGRPIPLADREILSAATQVGYSGLCVPAAAGGNKEQVWQTLLASCLNNRRLWEEVRIKGGAYGAHADNHEINSFFAFSTYRDPQPQRSIKVFGQILEEAARLGFDKNEIEKNIIALVGDDLQPISPSQKGILGFRRTILGITDQKRRQKRAFLLQADNQKLKTAAEMLLSDWDKRRAVVLAGEEITQKLRLQLAEFADCPVTRLPQ